MTSNIMNKNESAKREHDPKLSGIHVRMVNKIFSIIVLMLLTSGIMSWCNEVYQLFIVMVIGLLLTLYQLLTLYKIIWREYFPYIFKGF